MYAETWQHVNVSFLLIIDHVFICSLLHFCFVVEVVLSRSPWVCQVVPLIILRVYQGLRFGDGHIPDLVNSRHIWSGRPLDSVYAWVKKAQILCIWCIGSSAHLLAHVAETLFNYHAILEVVTAAIEHFPFNAKRLTDASTLSRRRRAWKPMRCTSVVRRAASLHNFRKIFNFAFFFSAKHSSRLLVSLQKYLASDYFLVLWSKNVSFRTDAASAYSVVIPSLINFVCFKLGRGRLVKSLISRRDLGAWWSRDYARPA